MTCPSCLQRCGWHCNNPHCKWVLCGHCHGYGPADGSRWWAPAPRKGQAA